MSSGAPFLDVHRDMVMACARFPDETGAPTEQVEQFATTSKGLLALSGWLVPGRAWHQPGRDGSDWRVLETRILEGDIDRVWVINARHMRNLPGRKTDVSDAQWGCQLLGHGLVRPSFIPDQAPHQVRRPRPSTTRSRRLRIRTHHTRPHLTGCDRSDRLHADDDLAVGMTVLDVLNRCRDIRERVRPVDCRRELSGLDEVA